MAGIKHPTIGCCGIECGLCPRHYTDGNSRCPGCGGEGFEKVHPPCGYLTCCVKKHGLSVCGECDEYPCAKYEDREKIEKDSFVSHKRMFRNQEMIREHGLDAFLAEQAERITFLKTALERYNDGRNKNFFCIAAVLLSTDSLINALRRADSGENLRDVLNEYAATNGQELKLKK
jgi:hypothetical protein